MKSYEAEKERELKAQELFNGLLSDETCKEESWHGFKRVNLKTIKLVFNRAYRLKSTDVKAAIELINDLIAKWREISGSYHPESFFEMRVQVDLLRSY